MPKLFIALDFSEYEKSVKLIDNIKHIRGIGFKVGLQLFLSDGCRIMEYLNRNRYPVFLDLKFNDIPNTIAGAFKSVERYSPFMINMHISAGPAAMNAARDEVEKWERKPLLIGVTVLTSLMKSDLELMGFHGIKDIESLAISMSKAAYDNGLDGVVTSNHEVSGIKGSISERFLTVVPGIKTGTAAKDQKRTATVEDAKLSGADYIVIGRGITQADNPEKAVESILDRIDLFYVS